MNEIATMSGYLPYGGIEWRRRGAASIFLFRKGQRCRWLTTTGAQVGPDQRNVAPALAWALSEGYRS